MDSIKAPFELPPMQMPDIALPPMLMPNFALPSLDQKSIELPSINLPSMDFRLMDFSNFGAPDLQVPPPVVIGLCLAVSAVLIAGRGSSDTGAVSENSRKSKSTLKYEIPYDAAARLAYDAWCRDHGDAPFNAKGYAHFREIYEAKAVADATSKKLARELTVFENKARPSAPHRQVAARSTTKESAKVPFFFARVN